MSREHYSLSGSVGSTTVYLNLISYDLFDVLSVTMFDTRDRFAIKTRTKRLVLKCLCLCNETLSVSGDSTCTNGLKIELEVSQLSVKR